MRSDVLKIQKAAKGGFIISSSPIRQGEMIEMEKACTSIEEVAEFIQVYWADAVLLSPKEAGGSTEAGPLVMDAEGWQKRDSKIYDWMKEPMLVDVKYRNGNLLMGANARNQRWELAGNHFDIIEFRFLHDRPKD